MKPGKDFIGVGVGAFILNDKEELLMVLRAKNAKAEPNTWMIPGGSIDFNEKIEDAVMREIKEEIGVDIEIVDLLNVVNHILPEEKQHWLSPTFICRIKSGTPKIMEPHKHNGLRWFKLDDMPENLSQCTKDDVELYLKKN